MKSSPFHEEDPTYCTTSHTRSNCAATQSVARATRGAALFFTFSAKHKHGVLNTTKKEPGLLHNEPYEE